MLWWTIKQLKSANVSTRLQAVDQLAEDGSLKAGDALIGAFGDADESVRKAAAKALAYSRNELFLQPILRALRDKNEHTRATAADALRQFRNSEAIPGLVPALSDPSGTVRWSAARALEALGWTPADNATAARFAVARGKIEEAASCGPEAVDALTIVLQSGAYHQRREAVASLCHISDARVVRALLVALKDSDDQVRSAAVEALCKIADPESADALIHALNDPNKHVRAVATEALGQFGGPGAVEPLLRAFRDKQWEVREAACVALGRTKDPRAFDPLVRALKDGDREVREAAVRGLNHLNDPRAIGPLLGTFVDEHDSVRQLAFSALSGLDLHWEQSGAARAAMPMLQEALKHNQYWVRQAAADALARIGSLKHVEPVAVAPAEFVPAPVLIDVSHLRKQATVDVLVGLLSDFDQELRFAAAEALGRIGQASAIAPLARSLKDADKAVRKAAALALETLRGKPTPETNLILRGEDFPL